MLSDIKQCPYCAEDIKAAAIVCKHCGRELLEHVQKYERQDSPQYGKKSPPTRNRILIYVLLGLVAIPAIIYISNIRFVTPPSTSEYPVSTATNDLFTEIFINQTEQARLTEAIEPTSPPTIEPQATPTPIPTGIAEVVIPASEAHEYEGQSITVEIPKAYCSYRPTTNGEPTFCNDQPFPGHNFTLLVWGEDWSHFDGQCIWVIGTVELFDGKSQIIADTPSQVSLCP